MEGAFGLVRDGIQSGVPLAWATVVEISPSEGCRNAVPALGANLVVYLDGDPVGAVGGPDLDFALSTDARLALKRGRSEIRHYGLQGEREGTEVTVFIEVYEAPRKMIIFGAVDFTAALVRVAKVLGFHVTVCDARPVFATAARFPDADQVVADWPHRYLAKVADSLGPHDAICVLTHDHKFDIPALAAAVESDVGYVGAMGSRRTHATRVELLLSEGVSPKKIRQIMAPIGLDIGARTPEETAVSICAEIISLRAGVTVPSLRDTTGPIHRVAS